MFIILLNNYNTQKIFYKTLIKKKKRLYKTNCLFVHNQILLEQFKEKKQNYNNNQTKVPEYVILTGKQNTTIGLIVYEQIIDNKMPGIL